METTFKKEGRIDVETLITLHHLLPTDLEEDLVELLEENNPLRRKSIDCQNLYRFCGFVFELFNTFYHSLMLMCDHSPYTYETVLIFRAETTLDLDVKDLIMTFSALTYTIVVF